MRLTILPKTPIGKWSTGLIAAFIVFFVLFQLLVLSGQRGGDTFFSNPLLTIPVLLAATCGIFALVTGLIGVIGKKERSIIVFLTVLLGFFILAFVVGEIVVPH